MKFGAQLYTLHDYCKTLSDFSETLKKVRDIGYRTVQVSGTCPYEAEWLRDELKKDDLKCVITHIPPQRLTDEIESVIADHKVFDCKYIGLGCMPGIFKEDVCDRDFEEFAEKAKIIGTKIKDAGCYFMYHNHAYEFTKSVAGTYPMKYFAENIPSDIMGFTLDTYWVKAGGHDPLEWLRNLKGRIPCIHYKDMVIADDGEKRFAPVGRGILDFEKITEVAIESGTEYALVEQDNCYGEDPFDCLKESYDCLKSMGLES